MNNIFKYIKNPKYILDIGANIGEFSKKIYDIYPNCDFILIEPNLNCKEYLDKLPFEHRIIGLSNKSDVVDFYVELNNNIASGASIYKENTDYYKYGNYINYKISVDTLDNMNFYPECIIDLVKIDTQGSELDIIEGGVETLKRVKYLLIEVSVMEYNKNAPLFDVVHLKLREFGYKIEDILHYHKFANGDIFQMDIVYKNSELVTN
jgi:FkbM family methyltransferase